MKIFITTQFEGMHRYENAPHEVSYLRNFHRHIFKVKVVIEVFHNDRELEFILFKRYINAIIKKYINKANAGSCEMMAEIITDKVLEAYPERELTVEVSEDGENGAIFEPNK